MHDTTTNESFDIGTRGYGSRWANHQPGDRDISLRDLLFICEERNRSRARKRCSLVTAVRLNAKDAGNSMPEIGWTDTEEIGIRLLEAHPEIDPLSVRFTDLHQWVMQLDGFTGDAKGSNEKKLEAIQMAWYEEWQEENT